MFRILDAKIHHKLNANFKGYKEKTGIFDHIINLTFILTKCIMEKDKRHMEAQKIFILHIIGKNVTFLI